MRVLLEGKELLKKIYGKYEVFITPVLKFLLAFLALTGINKQMGYMERICNVAIVLIAALLCSFLPNGFILFFGTVFILLHCYAVGLETALVGFALFLIMALLFFRFSPKDSVVVALTPILYSMNIPYVVPVSMGLIGTPASAISVGCGVLVHYYMDFVSKNATAISAMADEETTVRLRYVIDGLIGNREIVIFLAAFAFTVIVTYIIRRLPVNHCWTIAIGAGAVVDVVILLLGDLMFDINISVGKVILFSLLSVAIAMVLQFFVFHVDFNKTEKVQFEDDEYYYYVKAVPKVTLPKRDKTVKKINSAKSREADREDEDDDIKIAPAAKRSGSRLGSDRGRGESTRVDRPRHRIAPSGTVSDREPIEEDVDLLDLEEDLPEGETDDFTDDMEEI